MGECAGKGVLGGCVGRMCWEGVQLFFVAALQQLLIQICYYALLCVCVVCVWCVGLCDRYKWWYVHVGLMASPLESPTKL